MIFVDLMGLMGFSWNISGMNGTLIHINPVNMNGMNGTLTGLMRYENEIC